MSLAEVQCRNHQNTQNTLNRSQTMPDLTFNSPEGGASAAEKPHQRIDWSAMLILTAVIIASTAALVLMSMGLNHQLAPSPAPAPAHSGTTCSASAVAAYPNGSDGVSVFVHTPGPD